MWTRQRRTTSTILTGSLSGLCAKVLGVGYSLSDAGATFSSHHLEGTSDGKSPTRSSTGQPTPASFQTHSRDPAQAIRPYTR